MRPEGLCKWKNPVSSLGIEPATLRLRVNEQRNILHEISTRKVNWIGHILRRNCLLQRIIEGKIKCGIEVTRRRGRRRRKLLDDLKERRGYSHLKEEALDCTIWTAHFGRGFGPLIRQTNKWMNLTTHGVCLYIKQMYRWRKLHNMDVYDLQFFPHVTRILLGWSNQGRQDWQARGTCGREDWCIRGLTGTPEGKRLYRRQMHRGEHNIKRSSWQGGSVWSELNWLRIGTSFIYLFIYLFIIIPKKSTYRSSPMNIGTVKEQVTWLYVMEPVIRQIA